MGKGGFPLSRNFHVRTQVNFTCVSKIAVMYDRVRVSVKAERGSTYAFTRDLPYIAFISFTRVKFAYVRTLNLKGKITGIGFISQGYTRQLYLGQCNCVASCDQFYLGKNLPG